MRGHKKIPTSKEKSCSDTLSTPQVFGSLIPAAPVRTTMSLNRSLIWVKYSTPVTLHPAKSIPTISLSALNTIAPESPSSENGLLLSAIDVCGHHVLDIVVQTNWITRGSALDPQPFEVWALGLPKLADTDSNATKCQACKAWQAYYEGYLKNEDKPLKLHQSQMPTRQRRPRRSMERLQALIFFLFEIEAKKQHAESAGTREWFQFRYVLSTNSSGELIESMGLTRCEIILLV